MLSSLLCPETDKASLVPTQTCQCVCGGSGRDESLPTRPARCCHQRRTRQALSLRKYRRAVVATSCHIPLLRIIKSAYHMLRAKGETFVRTFVSILREGSLGNGLAYPV